MKTEPTYYNELITRYLTGEASPEDIRELEGWVKADPTNREEFVAMHRTWLAVRDLGDTPVGKIEEDWKVLRERCKMQKAEGKVQNAKYKMQSAKIIAFQRFVRVAAVFLVMLIPAFLIYHFAFRQNETVVASADQITEYTLPDGSKVTLNKGATISYPSSFKGNKRLIKLSGEAWFEVTHDARHPFVVDAGKSKVEVLGTTFSVNTNAYAYRQEVVLQSGKVSVTLEKEPTVQVILTPGEKATVDADGSSIIRTTNEDVNFLAWKTRHIVFNNTSLNEAVALLSKVYGANIRISASPLGECKITATFDHQSLESVLNVLKATLDLEIRNTGDLIEISGICKNK